VLKEVNAEGSLVVSPQVFLEVMGGGIYEQWPLSVVIQSKVR
jgi:hypothetical protein